MAYPTLKAEHNVVKKGVHEVTSPFGYRTLNGKKEHHDGIDFVGKSSTIDDIVAIADGKVTAILNTCSGSSPSTGNYVKIDHGCGITSVYYHLKKGSVAVKKGDKVKAGQVLGAMGATGNVTGAHLHFGIKANGTWVDPAPYIAGEKEIAPSDPMPTYQVHTLGGKWYEWVTGYNDKNTDGYAGVEKKPADAIRIKANLGNVKYRAHTVKYGSKKAQWWPWVTDDTGEDYNSYAGLLGRSMDQLQIKLENVKGYDIEYRVSHTGSTGYGAWKKNGATAGTSGKPIDKVQIRIVKK